MLATELIATLSEQVRERGDFGVLLYDTKRIVGMRLNRKGKIRPFEVKLPQKGSEPCSPPE